MDHSAPVSGSSAVPLHRPAPRSQKPGRAPPSGQADTRRDNNNTLKPESPLRKRPANRPAPSAFSSNAYGSASRRRRLFVGCCGRGVSVGVGCWRSLGPAAVGSQPGLSTEALSSLEARPSCDSSHASGIASVLLPSDTAQLYSRATFEEVALILKPQ